LSSNQYSIQNNTGLKYVIYFEMTD